MHQTIKIGRNSVRHLGDILRKYSPEKILIVTGKKSFEISGAKKTITKHLAAYQSFRFSDFNINPKSEDVGIGIQNFAENNCDIIIAIGGGSVIDMAKLIKFFSLNKGSVVLGKYTKREGKNKIPLIAIPTTAGTGSEATHFAVVYEDGIKYSIADKNILPDFAIIDPQLTYTNPPYLAACAGADALCQGIESLWALGSNPESKEYAKKAIKLIWNNLGKAVIENDLLSKDKVSEGAYWAGKAINISKTTASHALSYKLTSLYNIPHGHAVALTLDQIMSINYISAKEEIQYIFTILNSNNLNEAIQKLKRFWTNIGLSLKLTELGIKEKDIPIIADCNYERLANNPVEISNKTINQIFFNLL